MLKGKHIRIITPLTSNGNIPLIENGQQQFRTDFAPMSAKKHFEKKNARLQRTGFKHLMSRIEEVTDEPEVTAPPVAEKSKKAAAKQAAENKPEAPQNISDALAASDTVKL